MKFTKSITVLSLALLLSAGAAQTTGNPPAGAPPGPPPEGTPPGPPPDGGAPNANAPTTCTATFKVDGKTLSSTAQTYKASDTDQSGVCVLNQGVLTLKDARIITSGKSSSSDSSSFYGLNAGILAMTGTGVTITGGSVVTSGNGANAVFAFGAGTNINIAGTTIQATGQYAHGIMSSGGGSITATNLTASTTGANSAVIATDRGGGTIIARGGTYSTAGTDSPGLYSTGTIKVSDATVKATGAEAAVIEGSNHIEVTNSTLSGAKKSGVMLYQSFSGDALGSDSSFSMTGGSLTATDGPLFYVTNANGDVTLNGVKTSVTSGVLLKASADKWGASGSNGGHATLTATGQTLAGDVVADGISTASLTLKNSVWTGALNTAATAKTASLTLDAGSVWNVTANSNVTALSGAVVSGNTISNIKGSASVTYDASKNSALGGKTYALTGGGTLKPR